MEIVCLDLEGVIGTGDLDRICRGDSGIPELKKTTRDEPDYDKLMNCRIGILKEHGLGLEGDPGYHCQRLIRFREPKEFLDELTKYYTGYHYQRYLYTVCQIR